MKRIISLLFVFTIVLSLNSFANAQELAPTGKTVFTYGDWSYEIIDSDQYEIEGTTSIDSDITLPNSFLSKDVTSLGNHVFVNSETLMSFTALSPLNKICEYAFLDAAVLTTVTLPSTLTTIEIGAFSGTSALCNINIEDTGISSVAPYCFMNSGLITVELPETCTSIANYAFGQCKSLKKIMIPASVTSIHEDAFKGSDNVVIYCYTDSYAHQYAEANGIEYVLIDRSVEYTFILGDADGDGVVTIIDATVIQRVLVYLMDDPDGMIELRAAVDGDDLNITHATKIQRYLADFAVPEPIGTEVTRVIPALTQV